MISNIIPEMALRTKRGSINSSSLEAITPLSILIMPPVILRVTEGEFAESIIQRITLALRERGDRRRRWVRVGEKHFLTPLIRPRAPSP